MSPQGRLYHPSALPGMLPEPIKPVGRQSYGLAFEPSCMLLDQMSSGALLFHFPIFTTLGVFSKEFILICPDILITYEITLIIFVSLNSLIYRVYRHCRHTQKPCPVAAGISLVQNSTNN